ncbi:MAG: HEAT repeat domain-containing protein [Gemmatimonadaceae bacterium]
MKFITSFVALVLAATTLGAQQIPPTPPARPLPAPRPLRTPIVAPMPFPDVDLDIDPTLTLDFQRQSRELADEARAQARLAMQNVDVQQLRDMAIDQARQAMNNLDQQGVQETAGLEVQRALANLDLSGLGRFDGDERFAHSPRAPWAHDDPADSLYRTAREAFNTGDWRRAADLFRDVVQKFPRSAYAGDCAYFEAFSRYRIGTTDELHRALTLLSDQRSPTASRGDRSADAAALAARIRGALAARGDQQAAAQIAREAEKPGGCDREEMSVRAEALNALGQMDPPAAAPLLRQVLQRRDPCSLPLRQSALFMVVRRGDTVATNTLISVATNEHEDPDLRVDAILFLGRLQGHEALTTLEHLMQSSTDDRVQRAAVLALARNDSPEARTGVRALIERDEVSESLRAAAINAIGAQDATPDDAAFLRTAYARMPSERLKQVVLSTLAQMGGPDNEQFLLTVARNPAESSEVRGLAIRYAGRLPSVSVADLAKLYDASESRNIREQIIGVLGRRSEPEAADKLMDIVRTGTDPNTRRDAISVLSRKKDDPRVAKFLLDLVSR